MTYASYIALAAAGISLYVAALSFQFSKAPGWRDQRSFSVAALAAGLYSALDLPTDSLVGSDATLLLLSRIQVPVICLHAFAWLRYSSAATGRRRVQDRALAALLAALAVGAAVPGAYFTGVVHTDLALPYYAARTPVTTPLGSAAYALVLSTVFLSCWRFAQAWRRGVANAGVQFVSLAFLLAIALNDFCVIAELWRGPYLTDLAFLLPIAAVGFVLARRFVEAARAHEALARNLEDVVAQRTAELGRTQDALHRAERLATLGQFAAGVAHEVNNPAAVVNANLTYLAENEHELLSPSGREAVDESRTAMRRVGMIVRQLLDTGRLAASPDARTAVKAAGLVDAAFAVARARHGRRVRLTNLVPADVQVLAGEGILAQVMSNLVVNGVQAIPDHRGDGQVVVRAERAGERVRLIVEDDGEGMAPEILARVFQPFFTTKPFGIGTGLGLAVSRGLIATLGGDLHLESVKGQGTRAIVELGAASSEGTATPRAAAAPAVPEALRMLVVDDEEPVLASLARALGARYRVAPAHDVEAGLALLASEEFDLVLCDVMMPGGGGERLYRSVLARSPELARKFVFLTGGSITDDARRFLHDQPQPVLYKPLDVEAFAEIAERIGHPTH